MKNYKKVVAMLAVFYAVGIALLFVLTGFFNGNSKDTTVLQLNDIAKAAEENWEDLTRLGEKEYGVDFVILDSSDEIVYESLQKDAERIRKERLSPEYAVKNSDPYAYITKEDRILGVVILPDNGNRLFVQNRRILLTGFIILSLAFLLGALLFGVYVRKNIVDPFRRMEDFAEKVAQGNLDEPLIYDRGNLFGAFSESFDIMREELQASRKRENALQKKERELVASLSHDLKTPITGIKLTTELLKTKAKMMDPSDQTADLADKLDHIEQKANQIDVLVNDLFSSTLEDLGEFKVSCTDETAGVLHEIVVKNDDKELVCEGEVPDVIICMDCKRMSQVIGNIIANSYKYAGTKIDVAYRITDAYLEMKLQDHGPGVPADELDLITNKFYRGKDWVNSREEGSGLGLYIAKTLMEKMGGELIPESSGAGFCVTLLIPLS